MKNVKLVVEIAVGFQRQTAALVVGRKQMILHAKSNIC